VEAEVIEVVDGSVIDTSGEVGSTVVGSGAGGVGIETGDELEVGEGGCVQVLARVLRDLVVVGVAVEVAVRGWRPLTVDDDGRFAPADHQWTSLIES
jgi:hypothetical protein